MTLEEKLEQAMARAAMLREALRFVQHDIKHPEDYSRAVDALAESADVSAWLAERDARHAAELAKVRAELENERDVLEKACVRQTDLAGEALAAEADAEALAGALRMAMTALMEEGYDELPLMAQAALARHKTGAALEAERERVRAEERAKCEAENAEFEAEMEADLRELTPEEEAKCKSEVDRVMAKFKAKMAENAAHDARVCAEALEEAAKAIDSAQPRSERARLARMIRALASPPAKRETP
jgi:hypothetical protein